MQEYNEIKDATGIGKHATFFVYVNHIRKDTCVLLSSRLCYVGYVSKSIKVPVTCTYFLKDILNSNILSLI